VKHLLRIAAVLAIAGLPVAAHAQELSGGVRAGVNFADMSFDPSPPEGLDSDKLTGLVVGFFATVPINRVVAFQPEGLFSMQGTQFSAEGMTVKLKIDYFQVPLLGRFRLGSNSPVSLLVGPSLGFKTRSELDVPGVEEVPDFEDSIKGFDFGFVTGAALEAGHFVVDGRYTWGLTNIAKPDPEDTGRESAKHRVLSLTAGFRF
jgi:hypothetical protein